MIWLRKICVSMFNQQDSTLSVSYRYLMRLIFVCVVVGVFVTNITIFRMNVLRDLASKE